MVIEFRCKCGHAYHVADEMGGKRVVCKQCQASLTIPRKKQGRHSTAFKVQPEPLALTDMDPVMACPSCGATLQLDARICVECGYDLESNRELVTGFSRAADYYIGLAPVDFLKASFNREVQDVIVHSLRAYVGLYLLFVASAYFLIRFCMDGIGYVFGPTVGTALTLFSVAGLALYCFGGMLKYLFAYCEEQCHRGGQPDVEAWGNWQSGLYGAVLLVCCVLPPYGLSLLLGGGWLLSFLFCLYVTGPLLFLSVADARLDWVGLDPKRLLHWFSVMGGAYLGVCLLLMLDTLVLVWIAGLVLGAFAPVAERMGIPGGVLYLLLAAVFGFTGLVHVGSYMTTLTGKLYRIYDNRLYNPARGKRMVLAGLGLAGILLAGFLGLRTLDSGTAYRLDALEIPGFRGGLRDLSPERIRAGREFLEAAQRGHVEAMRRILLDSDIPLSVGSVDRNQTALHMAVIGRRVEVVRFLQERSLDMDLQDRDGNTAMHLAAEFGSADMLRLLLEGGAGLDVRNGQRQTPLHRAAWSGQREAVRFLLDQGADATARDAQGHTPEELAAEQGFPGVVEILEKRR